ncbi:MAG TPA: hypothetical protein VFS20_23575 [Longimicrobium sp.]|nr:hypothetical protein [Longimicrobium sp.]
MGSFPRLRPGGWCITGEPDASYNCYAWTIGSMSRFLYGEEVDRDYGDGNGRPEIADFDAFYSRRGLQPGGSLGNSAVEVALYGRGTLVLHAARKSSAPCGFAFESKLGRDFRIVHDAGQLEDGSYGNLIRFYVRRPPTMAPPRTPRPPRVPVREESPPS